MEFTYAQWAVLEPLSVRSGGEMGDVGSGRYACVTEISKL